MAKDRENPLKKIAMLLLWRTQQIAAPTTLMITALTLTLSVSNKIEWRLGSPYVTVVLVFMGLLTGILALGFVWDKKLRMWHEQNVINVERNPYYMFKQTPKEIVSFKKLWFPLLRNMSAIAKRIHLDKEAQEVDEIIQQFEGWCDEQLQTDDILRGHVGELSKYLESKLEG